MQNRHNTAVFILAGFVIQALVLDIASATITGVQFAEKIKAALRPTDSKLDKLLNEVEEVSESSKKYSVNIASDALYSQRILNAASKLNSKHFGDKIKDAAKEFHISMEMLDLIELDRSSSPTASATPTTSITPKKYVENAKEALRPRTDSEINALNAEYNSVSHLDRQLPVVKQAKDALDKMRELNATKKPNFGAIFEARLQFNIAMGNLDVELEKLRPSPSRSASLTSQ